MRGRRGVGSRRSEGGRGRGSRNLSPNPRSSKMKDGERNDNPVPRPPRRSPSPFRGRTRQSPSHQRVSAERMDHGPGRLDRGKQAITRPTTFESDGYEFSHKYMQDRPAPSGMELNQDSKSAHMEGGFRHQGSGIKDLGFRHETGVIKDAGFHHQGGDFRHQGISTLAPTPSGLRGPDVLLQNSSFLDNGNASKFYTVPPGTGYLSNIAPENVGGSGFHDRELIGYHDRTRDHFSERDKGKMYPDASSFPPREKTFGGTSSSDVAKGDFLNLYRDRLPHPSDGFSRPVGVSKLLDEPLEHSVYGQPLISDPLRRAPLSPSARYAPRESAYYEIDRSVMKNDRDFLAADDAYKQMHSGNRADLRDAPASSFMHQGFLAGDSVYKKVRVDSHSGDFRDVPASSFMNLADDRVDGSLKNSVEGSLRAQHRSLHGDAAMDYRDTRVLPEDRIPGFGNDRDTHRMISSRDNEVALFEERYAVTRGPAPVVYRERSRSPFFSNRRHMDTYHLGVNRSQGVSHRDNIDVYDDSPKRMSRGKYGRDDDFNTMDRGGRFSNDRSAFRRLQSPSGSDEMSPIGDRLEFPLSKRLAYGQVQHRKPTKRSGAWLRSRDSSAHGEGGHRLSLKKRLRPGPSEFNDSLPVERRHGYLKPNKSWKRGFDDANQKRHHGDTFDDRPPLSKTDPPEDSEEFKHQIHKAFLRFCKVLNEDPHQQKKYQEQGKAGTLLCCVCGRLSKHFVDTHSLVTHSYNSLKTGLRTEHLGLHKALCVLMDWNWLMPPDTGKTYQSTPVAEAEDLKADLILWPPVVIVHNSSIRDKNDGSGAKVVTVEGMEDILREMGFGAGKTQVGQGKSSNQNVLLVKFMPTFSGLQEAERLHKHYAVNNRGREEFRLVADTDDKVKEAVKANEELLYGYMAVAEDLGKLDPGTKKRSVVKSRKDIEAIADAPLNAD